MILFRHLMEALLDPFFLILAVFTGLLILLSKQRNQSRLFWVFLGIYVLLILLSTGILPQTLINRLENKYSAIKTPNPDIHWIVILGGGYSENENKPANMQLSSASIIRLVEGIRLYKQLPSARLIMSGGSYGKKITQAESMATLAEWFAVPKKDVVLESRSINTADEAEEIKKMIGTQPFYLVTSAIHMPRSMSLCLAQGLNPVPAPTGFTTYWRDERWEKTYLPNPLNLVYLDVALHEILGITWAKLTGTI